MSVTSGFFNSLNHDRRYNAQQMSAIFDGIINDGVFANIGVAFAISVDTGVTINIGEGKAWFNSAWVYNDALLPKTLEGSEVVLDRIDAVVIEVDHNESVRMGDIKIVKGTPSSSPKNPTMANETNKHQYPLAYIYRKAGSTEITQADITNMVGTSSCPYITGILQVQSIDNIVAQWEAQWNRWYTEQVSQADIGTTELLAEMKSEFDIWFNDIQALLDDDVATSLTAQIAELMGKFDDLTRDSCVYDTIEDSDLDTILGSDGTPLQGKTVLGGGGSAEDIDLSGYAKKKDLEAVAESKLDRTEKFVRNLLDNSDFTNPVNQRGQTSYESYFATTFDRWLIASQSQDPSVTATVSKTSDGLKFRAASNGKIVFGQRLPAEALSNNKTYTAVACKSDGTLIWGDVNDYVETFGFWSIDFHLSNNDVLVWAALYEGEYTAETLPEYRPKGYSAELLECQRYYYRFGPIVLSGVHLNSYISVYSVKLPTHMRSGVTPTVNDRSGGLWEYFPGGTVASASFNSGTVFGDWVSIWINSSHNAYSVVAVPDFSAEISADL